MQFPPKRARFFQSNRPTNKHVHVAGCSNVTPQSLKNAFLTTKNILHDLFLHLLMNKVIILENYCLCIHDFDSQLCEFNAYYVKICTFSFEISGVKMSEFIPEVQNFIYIRTSFDFLSDFLTQKLVIFY